MPELIDRQAVRLLESDADAYTENWNDDYEKGFCDAINKVLKLPTIEAEPVRHGRWEYRHADDWMFCTACGADAEGNYDEPLETDFCPHCGADMR